MKEKDIDNLLKEIAKAVGDVAGCNDYDNALYQDFVSMKDNPESLIKMVGQHIRGY